MDGSLPSSRHSHNQPRYSNSNSNSNYNYNRRGGGRGGRSGGYNRRNDRRHQPYNRRGGGRGGGGGRPRHPANRFDRNASRTQVDPQAAMLNQLSAMVAKMGDLTSSPINLEGDDGEMRSVVKNIARNVQDLTGVLCSPSNAPLFLKFDAPSSSSDDPSKDVIDAGGEAGPLATLVTSCAASLPLQSPSYVGLTLDVEESAPENVESTVEESNGTDLEGNTVTTAVSKITSYKGFARRCVVMACRRLAADLDDACGVFSLEVDGDSNDNINGDSKEGGKGEVEESTVDAFMRCKLLLRYLALLSKIGIIRKDDDTNDNTNNNNNSMTNLSFYGLLKSLTEAACNASLKSKSELQTNNLASSQGFHNTSILLSILVLSTLPHVLHFMEEEKVKGLMEKIEGTVVGEYVSPYQPEVGLMALLLKREQMEEAISSGVKEESDEEEEDDEEDDDDDDESAPVCADTLQDLIRTIKKMVQNHYRSPTKPNTCGTRYALPFDAPWLALSPKETEYAPMEGDADDELTRRKKNSLTFSGESLLLDIAQSCRSLYYLLRLDDDNNGGDGGNGMGVGMQSDVVLQRYSLEGIVFGRLSIFDPPPSPDDEEEEEDSGNNPEKEAYVKTFSLMDRYFLSEAVRDCLICHRSIVSDSGLEKGSTKDVAEQIWAIGHLFLPPTDTMNEPDSSNSNASRGIEFGIVETILSLLLQAPRAVQSSSPLSHIYLSKVLLDLTKNQSSKIPQALAAAVSILFHDFLPTMTPAARENMSHWLSFHLTNTEYQWPKAHWTVWTPYVVQGLEGRKRNSRGECVVDIVRNMASYVSSPELIVEKCLPAKSPLCKFIYDGGASDKDGNDSINGTNDSPLESLKKDIEDRIWKNNDDPDAIREQLIGDEISESIQGNMIDEVDGGSSSSKSDEDKLWWRTKVVIRTLTSLAERDHKRLNKTVEKCQIEDSVKDEMMTTMMEDEEDYHDPKEDALVDTIDVVTRYRSVILATMAKDIQVFEDNLDLRGETKRDALEMKLMGEVYVLGQFWEGVGYSDVLMRACVETCVKSDIVSVLGVLWWVLDNDNKESSKLDIPRGWWKLATMALALGVRGVLSGEGSQVESLGGGDDIGMIIDSGGDDGDSNAGTPSVRRMRKVTDFVIPLLKYASSRVQDLLSDLSEEGRKSMLPVEIDLMEGLKYFVRSASANVRSTLKSDPIVKATTEFGGAVLEVENWVAKCGIDSLAKF